MSSTHLVSSLRPIVSFFFQTNLPAITNCPHVCFQSSLRSHTTNASQQKKVVMDENPSSTTSTAKEVKKSINVDPAFLFDSASSMSGELTTTNEFKFGEFVICHISETTSTGRKNRKRTNWVNNRLVKLHAGGVFRMRYFDLFHEHMAKLTSLVFFNVRYEFRRPSLYEYVSLKEQQAVSSHFSIISLVPLLLELDKGSRVLECGTGSGSMTLFLSQNLGHSGLLHTFDIHQERQLKAAHYFQEWQTAYDLRPGVDKWPKNVKFGCMDLTKDTSLVTRYRNFYDAIYLDMARIDEGVLKAYELLRPGGVLVLNCLHLTQVLRCLNVLEKKGVHGLKQELVIEPSNRFWEMRKLASSALTNKSRDHITDSSSSSSSFSCNLDRDEASLQMDQHFGWTMRLEDRFFEKFKRGGLFFNYWQGFLVKFRKID